MSIDTIITKLRQLADDLRDNNSADCDPLWITIGKIADQLSACRTAEGAVCRMCGEAMTKEFGPVIEPAVAWDRDWLARDNWEPLPTGTRLYLHPAKAVPEGEVRIVCDWADPGGVGIIFVEAENANGESISIPWHDRADKYKELRLAHPAPVASRVTVDEAMVSRFCETYFGGGWPGVGGQVRADVHAALKAALTTPKENAK